MMNSGRDKVMVEKPMGSVNNFINQKEFFQYFVWWLLISVGFTAIQIQQSLRQGQLAFPPVHDDVVYFNDALRRLQILYDRGVASLIPDYIAHPPHSPSSTFLALLGYAIFGVREWVPAAMNGFLILGLLILLDYLTQNLSLSWKLVLVLLSLTWLLSGHAVIEFRPDILCGLLTATFIILISDKPWLTAHKNRHSIIGILIGLALLAKPTVSPATLIIAIFSIALTTLIELRIKGYVFKLSQIILPAIRCLGVVILVASPHYIVAYKRTANYIYTTLVVDKDLWFHEYTLPQKFQYYMTGQGGDMMMGHWFWLWIIIAITSLLVIAYRRDWGAILRVSALSGSMLFAYVVITLSAHQTPFIGVVFPCLFLITSIKMLAYLIDSAQISQSAIYKLGMYVGISALCLVAILFFQWPSPNDPATPKIKSIAEAEYYRNIHARIYAAMEVNINKFSKDNPLIIYLTSTTSLVNSDNLEYYLSKWGIHLYRVINYGFIDNLNLHIKVMEEADYIIAFSPDEPTIVKLLPNYKIQKNILEFIKQSKRFKLVENYKNPYRGGTIFLYTSIED